MKNIIAKLWNLQIINGFRYSIGRAPPTPTPTATVSNTVTPTVTPSITVTPTIAITPTATLTPTSTVTQSVTSAIVTVTPTTTRTVTPTISNSPTHTITPTVTPSTGSTATFAGNQPAGLTAIVDRTWLPTDSSIPGGVLPPSSASGTDSFKMGWLGADGSNTTLPLINTTASLASATGISVTAPPDGASTFMAIRYPGPSPGPAQPMGTAPFRMFYNGTISTKQIYHCCWIYLPPSFNDNGNNIKWNGIESGGANNTNHIFMLVAGEADNRLCWLTLQGGAGNRELGGPGNDPNFVQCLPPPPPTGTTTGWLSHAEGKWSLFEYWAKQETTTGVSADGQFMAWVDGVRITFYNNINFNGASGDPGVFNITNLIPYYGGGGSAAPSNQYIFVSRWYVAIQ